MQANDSASDSSGCCGRCHVCPCFVFVFILWTGYENRWNLSMDFFGGRGHRLSYLSADNQSFDFKNFGVCFALDDTDDPMDFTAMCLAFSIYRAQVHGFDKKTDFFHKKQQSSTCKTKTE